MKLLFIQTGGTIDKDYPRSTQGYAFEFGEPAVERILEKLNPSFDFEIITACQKDSLELTKEDRLAILNSILNHEADGYIITHGTDTMIETAEFLEGNLQDKRVVIVGAMRPERFTNSDAAVNLGLAIATMQLVAPGIYITMHGIVKLYSEIERDLETGKYY